MFNRPRYATAKIVCEIEETETKKAERVLFTQVAETLIETHMRQARMDRGRCTGFGYDSLYSTDRGLTPEKFARALMA